MEVPVLIVGAGPVGMSLALLLERFEVESLVVERHPTTTPHPKAYGCTARTMEHFRVWGIEDRVRGAGLPPGSDVIAWCESLSGPIVALTHPEPSVNTPAPKSIVPQDAIEEALDDALDARPGVDLRRQTRLESFVQDDDGVTALLRRLGDGEELTVRARFMVGCDGGSSTVRDLLGIEMEGPGALQRRATHYFRAAVGHMPHVRDVIGFLCRPRDRPALDVLGTGPDGDRWRFIQWLKDDDEQPYSEEHLIALVREYWGIPDLHVEPINVQVWNMSAQVAKQFRQGWVFLAGDAAHRFPPAGGIGMNSGIQDVHNLAWKLVAVLAGHAGDALLDSYHTERHPLAWSNTNWSVEGFDRIEEMDKIFHNRDVDPDPWRELLIDQDKQIHCEGQAMGFVYADGAVVDDGSALPPQQPRYYWPTDRPGARFPHFWIDASHEVSSIDWFDTEFVLVCGPDATAWQQAGNKLAETTPVPLVVRVLPHMVGPLTIERDGAVLVRPDGHVAWRAKRAGDATELTEALTIVLAGGSSYRSHQEPLTN
ncbi:FAD-dependent monooxygenase [Streptomyces brasiliensis]|nr:FAD-dependent monooxygenase [Streptomyces brasiliensis]